MNDAFVEFVSSFGDIGTLIMILIVGGPIVYGFITFIKKTIQEHDDKVTEETIDNENEKQFIEDISSLVETVNNIQTTLINVCHQTNDLQKEFNEQIQNLNEKMDEINQSSVESDKTLQTEIKKYTENLSDIKEELCKSDKKMNLMIDSDKEMNKVLITNMYYETIEKGWIPIYKLKTLETIYEKYLQQNGDTFVASLMAEIRQMPHSADNIKAGD